MHAHALDHALDRADLAAIVGSVNESEVFRFVSKPWDEAELRATLAEAVDVAIALEIAALAPAPALPPDSAVLVLGDVALARAARELGDGRAARVRLLRGGARSRGSACEGAA